MAQITRPTRSSGLRFLHAANTRLDVAIRGVGQVGGPVRRTLEDISLHAFDRLVAAAIEHSVDVVLLGGNTFRIADRSLRARLRVEAGLADLSEAGIATVANCGPLDLPSAWYDLALPEEVAILTDRDPAVELETEHGPVTVSRGDAIDGNGVQIVLMPADAQPGDLDGVAADYIGLAGGCSMTTEVATALVHDPGPLCPPTPDDHGVHGATLVEHTRSGFRTTPLDLSPLLCVAETIEVDEDTDIETLATRMQQRLADLSDVSETDEAAAMVVTWQLDGSGPVTSDLALDGTWGDLLELVGEVGTSRVHLLRREPAAVVADDVAAMLTDELGGYFAETDQAVSEAVAGVNHTALRERIDSPAVHERIERRAAELARIAIGPEAGSPWSSDAA